MLKSLFNKVADLKACSIMKKRLQHRCFPVKFMNSFKHAFFYRTPPVAASIPLYFTEQLSVFAFNHNTCNTENNGKLNYNKHIFYSFSYSPNRRVMVLWKIVFEVVIVIRKDKKNQYKQGWEISGNFVQSNIVSDFLSLKNHNGQC